MAGKRFVTSDDVETQVFDAGHESGTRMLSHVNRWMMDGICSTV